MIPSFFNLHEFLIEFQNSQDKNFNFKITFRTFGVDQEAICDEFIEYLQDKHPYFKNPFPVDKINHDKYANCGKIMRSLTKQDDIILIMGVRPTKSHKYLTQINLYRTLFHEIRHTLFTEESLEKNQTNTLKFLQESDCEDYSEENFTIIKGIPDIQNYFIHNQHEFLCIQDDYEAWEFNDQNHLFAKPLILDSSKNNIQQIMLDDH